MKQGVEGQSGNGEDMILAFVPELVFVVMVLKTEIEEDTELFCMYF